MTLCESSVVVLVFNPFHSIVDHSFSQKLYKFLVFC